MIDQESLKNSFNFIGLSLDQFWASTRTSKLAKRKKIVMVFLPLTFFAKNFLSFFSEKSTKFFLLYSVFRQFRQAKFANNASILSLSHFLILPRLSQKIKLAFKVVKIDSKIIILPPWSKSTKLTVGPNGWRHLNADQMVHDFWKGNWCQQNTFEVNFVIPNWGFSTSVICRPTK
jgi:hypothetical protein